MGDPFKAFVEQMARMTVPGDNDDAMIARVKAANEEIGACVEDPAENVIVCADDEFLCNETQAFWSMIREARELLK